MIGKLIETRDEVLLLWPDVDDSLPKESEITEKERKKNHTLY